MASSALFLLCLAALYPMFLSQNNPPGVDVHVLTEEQFCELLKNLSSLAEGITCSDLFENDETVQAIVDAITRKPPTKPPKRDDNIELNQVLLAFISDHLKNLVEDAGHEPPAEVPVVRAGRDVGAVTEARSLSRSGGRQRLGHGGRGSKERHGGGGRGSQERHGGGWKGGFVPPIPFFSPNLNGIIVPVTSNASPVVGGRKRSLESEVLLKRQLQTQMALVNGTTRSSPRRLQQGDVTKRIPFNVDQFSIKGNRKSDKKSQVTPAAVPVISGVTPTSAARPIVKVGKPRSRPNSNPRIFPQRG